MPSPFDCRLGPIWNPDVVVGESTPAVCASRIVAVDNRVRVVNVAEVRSLPMGSATEAWDDGETRGAWRPGVEAALTSFLGYVRPNGCVGTRNYIGILPSVNCAATVARLAATVAAPRLTGIPSCDGVIALAHELGCGMAQGTT